MSKFHIACFILLLNCSCTPLKKYISGYKEKISSDEFNIKESFESRNSVPCNFYKQGDPKELVYLLSLFSNSDSNTNRFELPLPVVYDNQNKKFLKLASNQKECFGGFEDKINALSSFEYYETDPVQQSDFFKNVLGIDTLSNSEKYNLFIFWTQKTYRANRKQMARWIKVAKPDSNIKVWAINIDLCLFAK